MTTTLILLIWKEQQNNILWLERQRHSLKSNDKLFRLKIIIWRYKLQKSHQGHFFHPNLKRSHFFISMFWIIYFSTYIFQQNNILMVHFFPQSHSCFGLILIFLPFTGERINEGDTLFTFHFFTSKIERDI